VPGGGGLAGGAMLEFRMLGPLEVWAGAERLDLGGPKPRAILAVLLVNANQVVSIDRLIDEVWGEAPPPTARNLIQCYVSRVRRVLRGRSGSASGQVLVTRPPGYLLQVEAGELDLHHFEGLAGQARRAAANDDLEGAAEAWRAALALWRGPPLDGVVSEALRRRVVPRLQEARLVALEERLEVDLRLGRHADLVGELEALVATYPDRERLRRQLMLALYRSGRQVEALAVYRSTRQALAEELGLEPSPALQQLERAMLLADPILEPAPPMANDRAGRPATLAQPPCQLPPAIVDFTGRQAAVTRLQRLLAAADEHTGAIVVAAVAGKPGVGKTALVVHVAHRLRARFPDGQLYVNLRGIEARPVDPTDVLAEFLRALGVDSTSIPVGQDERARLFRSRLASRRVMVVLDNARDEAQVRPLLPGSSSCAVLLTSRPSLIGLEGASLLTLDVLEPAEALALLTTIIGPRRVAAEPEAATMIIERCGHWPLAIRIVGARLAARPHWRLSYLAERLGGRGALDELKAGDLDVAGSIALSYEGLSQRQRQAFRLLAALDAAEFPAWAPGALLDIDLALAEELIEQLADAHLLEIATHGPVVDHRYHFHDLLREFARQRLHIEESPTEQQAALRRFLVRYLLLAERADAALRPGASPPHGGQPASHRAELQGWALAELSDPLHWFEAERSGLIASVQQAHATANWDLTWRLAAALCYFFEHRADWANWRRCHLLALDAARRIVDRRGEGVILLGLGVVDAEQARFRDALDRYRQSLALFKELGDRWGQAHALHRIGELHWEQACLDEAVAALEQSVSIFRGLGDRHGQATALRSLALALDHKGRLDDALAGYQACLAMFRELGDRRFEATTLRSLGDVYCEQDRLHEAMRWLQQSLLLFRELGDRRFEALALRTLGDVHRKAGRHQEAIACLSECLRTCRELGDRRIEGYGLHSLGEVLDQQGQSDEALMHYQRALSAFRELGLPLWQGRILDRIGCTLDAQGEHAAAQQAWREAATILERLGVNDASRIKARLTL
jgi:DNA-binding SARP family transcriptional activator/tetratricopeptide (TPR) repeat protein